VNCDDLLLGEQTRLQSFAATIVSGEAIEIHGFASIEGDSAFNDDLSCARAIKVQSIFQGVLSALGVSATITLFKHGATPGGDAGEQRSVVVTRSGIAPVIPPTPTAPAFVCGPDVTTKTIDALDKTRTTFAGWSSTDQANACFALDSLITGGIAWDINELHNNAWILSYRPQCATHGATPACGSSVQIHDNCHYAGSVNYVVFGVMCKLCNSHFTAIGSVAHASEFTESAMLDLVNKYKGTGLTGLQTPSSNFVESKNWATAGYHGWPAAGDPSADRSNCAPVCPQPYTGATFGVHWVPMGWF